VDQQLRLPVRASLEREVNKVCHRIDRNRMRFGSPGRGIPSGFADVAVSAKTAIR
jgi:hypothetical protein